jgi:hypothetical protein
VRIQEADAVPSDVTVPRWALWSSIVAPLILLATSLIAAFMADEDYNATRETLSVLATTSGGAWVMTIGIAVSGACQIVTSVGLAAISRPARWALAGAGLCGVAVAFLPVTIAPTPHLIAAGGSAVLFCLWPLLAISRRPTAAATLRPAVAITASIILWMLLGWTVLETGGGNLLGLAERVNFIAEMVWPAVVVVNLRRRAMGVSAVEDSAKEDSAKTTIPN